MVGGLGGGGELPAQHNDWSQLCWVEYARNWGEKEDFWKLTSVAWFYHNHDQKNNGDIYPGLTVWLLRVTFTCDLLDLTVVFECLFAYLNEKNKQTNSGLIVRSHLRTWIFIYLFIFNLKIWTLLSDSNNLLELNVLKMACVLN